MLDLDETTKRVIEDALTDVEEEKDVEVLVARDVGSRSRGLDDDDSDYDVMFVFTDDPVNHATGSNTTTIEMSLYSEIDCSGWSLSKYLGSDGIIGSNPTAVEFASSPITYYVGDDTRQYIDRIDQVAVNEFKPYALINHYRSMAASNYGKYIEGDYKIADGASYNDLMEYVEDSGAWFDVSQNAIRDTVVDESETVIGEEQIEIVGDTSLSTHLGSVYTAIAEQDGIVEQTTVDRTVKRYLNIVFALTSAKHIEETHTLPNGPMKEWFVSVVDGHLIDVIDELISLKVDGNGDSTYYDEDLNEWIESELHRDIDPVEHVQRLPPQNRIRDIQLDIYEEVYS